jgi:DNA-binding NtrC family response regulator
LAEHFLKAFKQEGGAPHLKISDKAMKRMLEYDWPGNVRELRNAIERAVVMGNDIEIQPEDLPIFVPTVNHAGMEAGLTLKDAIDRFKKEFLKLSLKYCEGNRGKAAKMMDIQRTYLSRLIAKYHLQDV